ncbi:MAG: guanylate kinase [Oscillospiraceae bacterium]|nr:guanylate kinase [Oscillospiraceae bacterium]
MIMRHDAGKLLVVSGPSGAGKSTVIHKMMAGRDDIRFSVSATTRAPREGEIDGKDYYFLDRERFEQMIRDGAFLEHAQYVGNYYGTPAEPVMDSLRSGINVILDIEVQGASNVRKAMPEAVTVFLAPPSFDALEKRLRGRGLDSEEKIQQRLVRAREEYLEIPKYDYIVINDDADEAAQELAAILLAAQCRTADRLPLLQE